MTKFQNDWQFGRYRNVLFCNLCFLRLTVLEKLIAGEGENFKAALAIPCQHNVDAASEVTHM